MKKLFFALVAVVAGTVFAVEPPPLPHGRFVDLSNPAPNLVVVDVTAEGKYSVNGKEMTLKEIRSHIRNLDDHPSEAVVFIRAEPKTRHQAVADVMDACCDEGCWKLFLVGKGEAAKSPAFPVYRPATFCASPREREQSGLSQPCQILAFWTSRELWDRVIPS